MERERRRDAGDGEQGSFYPTLSPHHITIYVAIQSIQRTSVGPTCIEFFATFRFSSVPSFLPYFRILQSSYSKSLPTSQVVKLKHMYTPYNHEICINRSNGIDEANTEAKYNGTTSGRVFTFHFIDAR